MGDAENLIIKAVNSMADIAPSAWDACANHPPVTPGERPVENPFITHAFLSALEESGSATPQTGWQPYHLVLEQPAIGDSQSANPLGVVPMYLKSHSQGEYVFDHGWADALERAGGSYYPKLQVCVPFTPATGRRLLARPGPATAQIQDHLIAGCMEVTRRLGVSSLHMTFQTFGEWERAGEMGLLQRTDRQFHWTNEGYTSFDDFLAALASRKRKQLRKEREAAVAEGITIEWVTGADLTEDHWDAFYEFYVDTGMRKWGQPYLTRTFFSLINERLANETLLILAKREGRYIAGALNFIGRDTLFGRHWGCNEDHKFLHFELCYYQAIDFAIAHGLHRVEAGAQGAHKLARGYLPHHTYSAHYIAEPHFRTAIEDFLERERTYIDEDVRASDSHNPFKKPD